MLRMAEKPSARQSARPHHFRLAMTLEQFAALAEAHQVVELGVPDVRLTSRSRARPARPAGEAMQRLSNHLDWLAPVVLASGQSLVLAWSN